MNATSKMKPPVLRDGDTLFAVTIQQEIGTVVMGGDEHPAVTAFRLIAMHGDDGVYRFPAEDGSIMVVTVEREGTNANAR